MTKASEVTVSDAEVHAVRVILRAELSMPNPDVDLAYKTALAAFLAARVPDADTSEEYRGTGNSDDDYKAGATSAHNALRDAVLRGPQ